MKIRARTGLLKQTSKHVILSNSIMQDPDNPTGFLQCPNSYLYTNILWCEVDIPRLKHGREIKNALSYTPGTQNQAEITISTSWDCCVETGFRGLPVPFTFPSRRVTAVQLLTSRSGLPFPGDIREARNGRRTGKHAQGRGWTKLRPLTFSLMSMSMSVALTTPVLTFTKNLELRIESVQILTH